MENLFFALWFFLPAGIANMTPVIIAKVPILREWNTPADLGHKFHGKPILGPHKTIRGLVVGTLAGTWIFFLQSEIGPYVGGLDYTELTIWLGVLLGFGALFGDLAKSFFKRQLNVTSGKSWFPFDQLDYIIGGLLLSSLVVTLEFGQYLMIVAIWFILHLITSYVGYLTKFKKDPI